MTEYNPAREDGLARLSSFIPKAGRQYAARRNFDLGPGQHSGVSGLSPYLRHRMITEQEVVKEVLDHHSHSNAEKFIQEVFWRTYWKGWLERRPQVWAAYKAGVERETKSVADTSGLSKAYDKAIHGQTGIACFDAWGEELIKTGYLHNHARMWFASIWVFTLKLPWELGADFFLRHLLDGDAASNTLSWRWVAGLQTVGKTYLARADNIDHYTQGRFPYTTGLAQEALPLNEVPLPPAMPSPDVPPPPTQGRRVLLLQEDDLWPDQFDLSDFEDIAVLEGAASRGLVENASIPTHFTQAATNQMANDLNARLLEDEADIVNWVEAKKATVLVTPYRPIGPGRDRLSELSDKLANINCAETWTLRDWDRHCWPHAAKGFFAMKKQIPRLIRERL